MYYKITFKKLMGSFTKLSLIALFVALTATTINAQTLVNGNLGTSATSNNGTAAPAGTTWHELQNAAGVTTVSNSLLGVGHMSSGANSFTLADDFTVPGGNSWTMNSLTVYSLDQVVPVGGTTSPYTNIRVRIWNGVPGVAGSAVIFGDLTTNRFASTAFSGKKGIFNSQVPTPGAVTPNLPIFSITASLGTTLVLTPGNYWVEWQLVTAANCFSPTSQTVGIRSLASYNGRQSNAGVWAALADGGNPATLPTVPVDLPFTLTYTAGPIVACTGTPNPGNTITNTTTGCTGTPFTLSLQNNTPGAGITYQWQTAPALAGPFTPILGATNSTYSSTITATAFYRCIVTCAGNAGNSTAIPVNLTPPTQCYCTTSLASSTADEDIFNVTVGTLNNTSTCATLAPGVGSILNRYSNYTSGTGIPATPNVIAGANNPFSVAIGTCGGNFTNSVAIFIDLNQDGAFVPTERVYVSPAGSAGPHVESGVLVIPASATLGVTRMRVINVETGVPGSITACGGYTWGETEDYNVNLVPCVPVTITASPIDASTSCSGSASFTVTTAGNVPTFQWQYRTSATAVWQVVTAIAPAGAIFTGMSSNTLNINGITSPLTGYEFRCLVSGGCSAATPSNAAILTVTPLVGIVTPSSATVCAGANTLTQISIGNIGAPIVSNFASAANLALVIPETGAGVLNTIPVALPATAQISDIKVKLNITHTWVGDLIIALRSPSGKIFNLSYALNGTDNAGTGFTNTVISLNPNNPLGTSYPALSTGVGVFTNTFKADARTPATATPLDDGVTNVVRAVAPASLATGTVIYTSLPADMYGAVASGTGNWQIGLYDFYNDGANGGSINRLVNWSMDITYGALANGIFTATPATPNSMFTNAAGTIPYTGTAVNSIYVNPTASTSYGVAINTGTCTANVTVPVTVNAAAAGTLVAATPAICSGANAVISFTGLTGGSGLTYQWQMASASAPTVFTNITGANATTYSITGATTALNGNLYRIIVGSTGCPASLTSAPATLVVNGLPIVTISAAPVTKLFPGLTSTLTAAVSPAPSATTTYQWFRDGVAVTTALTNNKYIVNVDGFGSYTVKVVDGSSCTNSFTTPADITISDSANRNVLFIYPSPNSGRFQVRYFFESTTVTSTYVNIYDEKGARVFTRAFTPGIGYGQMNVDLGAHGRGVYRVDLLNANGERLKTGSVMVF